MTSGGPPSFGPPVRCAGRAGDDRTLRSRFSGPLDPAGGDAGRGDPAARVGAGREPAAQRGRSYSRVDGTPHPHHAELPVFYWGQAYFGAAEAYLMAALFAVFGFHAWLVFVPALLASVALIPSRGLAEYLGPCARGRAGRAAGGAAHANPVQGAGQRGRGFRARLRAPARGLAVSAARPGACPVRARWLALFSLYGAGVLGLAALVDRLAPLLVMALVRAPNCARARPAGTRRRAGGGGPRAYAAYNAFSGWPTLSALMAKYSQTQPAAGAIVRRPAAAIGRAGAHRARRR